MSQLVDPGQIPQVGTGIEWVETVAGWLQTDAIRIRAAGTDVTAAWSGLAGVYHAPEAAELVAALSPVAVLADQFGADVLVVAAALSQFAETVAPLRSRLLNAQYDANSLRTRAMATDHWDRHADMVAENNRLVWEVDAAFTAFLDAERRCANTIEGLVGGASWHAGDPSKDARANGPASIPDDTATPWGAPAKLHRSCVQASAEAASALNPLRPNAGVGQGELDAITGMAAGAWQMVDFGDPARFRATWSQIGVLATPLGGQRTAEAWLGVGKGMISWDEWSTNPSGAAGGALINVGSLFLPGAGEVGGAAKIAEGTGDAARFADAAKVAEAERVASELEAATVAELQFTEELVGRDLAALEGMPRAEDLDNLLRNKFGDLEGANSPVNQLEDKLAKSAAEAKAPAQASTSPDSVRRSASGSGNSGPNASVASGQSTFDVGSPGSSPPDIPADATPGPTSPQLHIVGTRFSESERSVAEWLAAQGRHVVLREAITGETKLSDLTVDGRAYDVYTPRKGTPVTSILSRVASKWRQVDGGGVIVDLRACGLPPDEFGNALARVNGFIHSYKGRPISDVIFFTGG